jgi:hypothetical protein
MDKLKKSYDTSVKSNNFDINETVISTDHLDEFYIQLKNIIKNNPENLIKFLNDYLYQHDDDTNDIELIIYDIPNKIKTVKNNSKLINQIAGWLIKQWSPRCWDFASFVYNKPGINLKLLSTLENVICKYKSITNEDLIDYIKFNQFANVNKIFDILCANLSNKDDYKNINTVINFAKNVKDVESFKYIEDIIYQRYDINDIANFSATFKYKINTEKFEDYCFSKIDNDMFKHIININNDIPMQQQNRLLLDKYRSGLYYANWALYTLPNSNVENIKNWS